MDFVNIINQIISDPWVLVKILFLIGFFIYVAFALIVVRQVKLMSQTLNGFLDLPLRMMSWIHFLVAMAVFVLALVIL